MVPARRSRRSAGPRADEFAGKVVVITGAGSGIGRETALLFARLGATVHVTDLDEASAERVRGEIEAEGGRAVSRSVDVTDPASVEALAAAVYEHEGAVDVLHNNAGIGHGGPVEETTLEDWQRVVAVNLMGVVHGVHAFVPRMVAQGRPAHIVNTASLAGLLPAAQLVPYSTTKAAVVGLSEALAAELGPRGIGVSALCPGIINTPIIEKATMRGEMAERHAKVRDFYARRGTSADVVAEAAVDAVRRNRLIQPTPRMQVSPVWWVKRASPRAGLALSRLFSRMPGTR